uniref:Uncharacterized protein n=1 Tax=Anguilla anguilla TaxID=7936 RepID=A0A0E9SFI5_ANGAN
MKFLLQCTDIHLYSHTFKAITRTCFNLY